MTGIDRSRDELTDVPRFLAFRRRVLENLREVDIHGYEDDIKDNNICDERNDGVKLLVVASQLKIVWPPISRMVNPGVDIGTELSTVIPVALDSSSEITNQSSCSVPTMIFSKRERSILLLQMIPVRTGIEND